MRPRLTVALSILSVPLLACLSGDEPPGEYFGTYDVTGTLVENECGPGVPALNPLSFIVELRRDGGAAMWRRPEAPLIYGVVNGDQWTIESSSVQGVYEPDPATGQPGCALTQTETILLAAEALIPEDAGASDAATPDASTPDASLGGDAGMMMQELPMVGDTTIVLTPTTGSDCSPTLVAFGGPFASLPCAIRYELQATPRDPVF